MVQSFSSILVWTLFLLLVKDSRDVYKRQVPNPGAEEIGAFSNMLESNCGVGCCTGASEKDSAPNGDSLLRCV